MVIIDYSDVIIWCESNIPTIYKVQLIEDDKVQYSYYLIVEVIKGTHPYNLTEKELIQLKKVLSLEYKSFVKIKRREISSGSKDLYEIAIK